MHKTLTALLNLLKMSDEPLHKRILQEWDQSLEGPLRYWRESETKDLWSDNRRYKFIAVYNESKAEYYRTGEHKKEKEKPKGDSPFSKTLLEKDKYIVFGNFVIRPTRTPTFYGHIILIGKKIKPEMTGEDFMQLRDLSRITDFAISVNLPGSGASLPMHFHAQGMPLEYPVMSPEFGAGQSTISERYGTRIERLVYPAYGVRVRTEEPSAVGKLASVLESMQQTVPFNVLMSKGDTYIYPRTKELPSCFKNWIMGVQEMGGIFCTRTHEMYDALDYATAEMAVKDVTFSDRQLQREFELRIQGGING